LRIAPFAPGNDRCIARPAGFPDRERRIVRRCVSQREDDSFRTKAHTQVFTAVFNGESCAGTIVRSTCAPGLNVTRSAL
jgi:hypothetical protein